MTQRFVCESILKGTDIYSLRGSSELYAGFHASPWGSLLENIFYGGFLHLEAAKVYFTVLHFFLLFLTSYMLYRKTKEFSKNYALFISLMSVLSLDSITSFYYGNAGAMISSFLIISWLICDEHPYIAGILTGFAMVKPQVTLIICLGFVILKRYMPVLIAAAVTIISWFIVSLMIQKGMFAMLSDFLFSPNTGSEKGFAGILSFVPGRYMTRLGMSMLFGIIFLCAVSHFLPDDMPDMFKMYPAFMASTFWCYTYCNDAYVLIFPSALCVFIMSCQKSFITSSCWFICALYCSYGLTIKYGSYTVYKLIAGTDLRSDFILGVRHTLDMTYDFGVVLVGILICMELRNIYLEAEEQA